MARILGRHKCILKWNDQNSVRVWASKRIKNTKQLKIEIWSANYNITIMTIIILTIIVINKCLVLYMKRCSHCRMSFIFFFFCNPSNINVFYLSRNALRCFHFVRLKFNWNQTWAHRKLCWWFQCCDNKGTRI